MEKEEALYSLNEMVTGEVYKHIENDHHYRLYEGELQKFSCGCWNESSDPILTNKRFTKSENWNEEGSYKSDSINIETESEEETVGLKIVNLQEHKAEKEAIEAKLPPLGKYDFIFKGHNIYLESTLCHEGGVHLGYYRLVPVNEMEGFMPDAVRKQVEEMMETMEIKKVMVRHPLEEWEIHLTKWDIILRKLGFNITIERKVERVLPIFRAFQERQMEKVYTIRDSATKINDLIKGN